MCGESASEIKYIISDIYLYGKQILRTEDGDGDLIAETLGEETIDAEGKHTANAFGKSTATVFQNTNTYGFTLAYPTPFTISYTYDKTHIEGNGEDRSKATMTLNLAWYNDEANNEEDTKLGNMAYDYKITNPDDPALKIVVKVIGRRTY